jgi:multiple sugar transport system permease protein
MMRDSTVRWVLLLPALIFLGATSAYPLLYSFYLSFHNWNLGRSLTMGPFVGLENYSRALSSSFFWESIVATAIFTTASVIFVIVLSIFVALLLSKEKPYISFVRSIMIIPFAMSPALVGFSWRFMLERGFGFLHFILGNIFPPLKQVTWVADPFYAMVALISVEVWIFVPLMSLIFISAIMALPKDVYEAARVDGASVVQSFFHITLPLLKPIILIATILMTMFSLKVFDPVVTLTQGGPGSATRLLNYSVYLTAFKFFDFGYAAALGYILAFILIAFQLVYMRFLVRGGGWK